VRVEVEKLAQKRCRNLLVLNGGVGGDHPSDHCYNFIYKDHIKILQFYLPRKQDLEQR